MYGKIVGCQLENTCILLINTRNGKTESWKKRMKGRPMKKMTALLFCFLIALTVSGCGHAHKWAEATCTEPKTCTECGETEGEALGHDWKEATCTEPKTCNRCGATKGGALGHDWEEQTYYEPKTCKECGETEGKSLEQETDDLIEELKKDLPSSKGHIRLKGTIRITS